MKTQILAIALVLGGSNASATALASIYNGSQYQLAGQLLVQDADHPNDFYYVPQTYHIKRTAELDEATQNVSYHYAVAHTLVPENNPTESIYNITVVLDKPGRTALDRATEALRSALNNWDARIVGLAPVCGIQIDVPGFDLTNSSTSLSAKANPNATSIRYSFASTEDGKCNFVGSVNQFNIEYRVPYSAEPATAKIITSKNSSLSLPPVKLLLPYKYKDKVEVSFNSLSALHQLKAAGDFSGSIKAVSFNMRAAISRLFKTLEMTGQLTRNCENPNPDICDQYLEMAKTMVMKAFYQVLPQADGGNTDPLSIGDKDKSVSMVKASLAVDEQDFTKEMRFLFSLNNNVYTSVHTQAQVIVGKIPRAVIAKPIRDQLPPNDDASQQPALN